MSLFPLFHPATELCGATAFCRILPERFVGRCFQDFISHARKPQAFKPGDEWHPFGAKRRPFPACLAWPKVMTGMPEA